MESEPTKTKRQRKFNREFQKNEVIRFLVRKEALDFIAEPLILGKPAGFRNLIKYCLIK